ncbi:MAG: hypothetical protein ACRKGH_09485 [Dehalogenimonas sp.]
MVTKTAEQPEIQHCDAQVDETLLIRQRLCNLCELAIAIGQQEGLLTNHTNSDVTIQT